MSLLAALAKGLGAGTVANANQGFDKIKRDQEAAERAALTDQEYNRRDSQIAAQLKAGREETDARIAANREDTNARLAAQSAENDKQRQHDLALFQQKLGMELQAANASANARGRETYAKNLMSSLDAINKRMAEVEQLGEDKISPEQRAKTMTGLKFAGAMITADPNAQQMLNEHGGGGYVTYFQSFMPDVSQQGEGGGEAPPPQATTAPPRKEVVSDAPDYAKEGYGHKGLIGRLHQSNGGSMAAGFDPQFRQPVNVGSGKPVKWASDFKLPTDDSHVPAYARYNK